MKFKVKNPALSIVLIVLALINILLIYLQVYSDYEKFVWLFVEPTNILELFMRFAIISTPFTLVSAPFIRNDAILVILILLNLILIPLNLLAHAMPAT